MALKVDPRAVDEIVRWTVHDPKAEGPDGDVLAQIVRRFPPGDDIDMAVNQMLIALREMVHIEATDAGLTKQTLKPPQAYQRLTAEIAPLSRRYPPKRRTKKPPAPMPLFDFNQQGDDR